MITNETDKLLMVMRPYQIYAVERISNLKEFTQTFLDKSFVSKVIARYMITNETDKLLMVMRPYQIYAVEALVTRAFETNNNGFIWHTTGSGKTLTSFKASQILVDLYGIQQVVVRL